MTGQAEAEGARKPPGGAVDLDRPLPDGDEDALSIHSSTSGYSASPPVESLVAGNKLSAGDRSGLGALAVQAAPKAVERVSRTGAVVEHKKKNKRKREKKVAI